MRAAETKSFAETSRDDIRSEVVGDLARIGGGNVPNVQEEHNGSMKGSERDEKIATPKTDIHSTADDLTRCVWRCVAAKLSAISRESEKKTSRMSKKSTTGV